MVIGKAGYGAMRRPAIRYFLHCCGNALKAVDISIRHLQKTEALRPNRPPKARIDIRTVGMQFAAGGLSSCLATTRGGSAARRITSLAAET
ncbi:hypothetical protein [Pararobbsia alpina]|uniref:hypothetical protein n=1 Tax=Pararobbsia alpina TaxID=621374 RepID=UPI0039A4528E